MGDLKLGTIALGDFTQFDIVHVHGPTPFLSDIVRANPSIRRLVLTYHSDNEWLSHSVSRAYLSVHKLLHSRTQGIILETNSYRQRYGSFEGRVAIIPPAGSMWQSEPSFQSRKNAQFTVIFVGQFRPYKGIPVLFEAARQLPQIRFVVCGGGRLESTLMRSSRDLPNVEFRGPIAETDLRSEYVRSHVVLLPSVNNSEAYGVTLLEGATVGAYPVASRLPGVSEHIDLLGGESFPVGKSRALASILQRLSEDHNLWAERALRSMQRAASYNETHDAPWYCDAHETFYREVMGC